MEKVELTKPHSHYGAKGTVVEVSKGRANYLKKVGAAKEYKAKKQTKELKDEVKTKVKKK